MGNLRTPSTPWIAPLTVHARFLCDAALDQALLAAEEARGPDNCWNSVSKLQECVSRGRTLENIKWFVFSIEDQILSGKLKDKEITQTAIRSQSAKSLSDPILLQLKLKKFLLGEWLDGKDCPPYVKAKAREVFASHSSYRALWAPSASDTVTVDTSWLSTWPKAGRDLFSFLGRHHLPEHRDGGQYAPQCAQEREDPRRGVNIHQLGPHH